MYLHLDGWRRDGDDPAAGIRVVPAIPRISMNPRTLGHCHAAASICGTILGELAQQVEEVVRYRFAKSVVIDGTKGAPEITRALPASSTFGSLGLLRVPGISGSLRVASLLGTQLLVPPARACRAHNQLIRWRNRQNHAAPFRYASSRALRGNVLHYNEPGPATETKWPVLCSSHA